MIVLFYAPPSFLKRKRRTIQLIVHLPLNLKYLFFNIFVYLKPFIIMGIDSSKIEMDTIDHVTLEGSFLAPSV